MKRIFIAFGHDPSAHLELEKFLFALGGLKPVLLVDQDDLGMTIVEKFEHYATSCEFAFVILTPDDEQAAAKPTQKWRARQNVILELGWFMRHVGRRNVVVLHKGDVEIPSDLLGVLYLPFSKTIYEVAEKIRQRLTSVGLLA